MKKLLLLCVGAAFLCGCAPSTVDDCLNAGAEHAARKEWKDTLKLAERAIKLDSGSVSAHVMRAIACERLGETDKALDSARKAAALNPESFPAQYTLGRLYAANPARLTDALPPLIKASKLKKDQDKDTLILLANAMVTLRSPLALRWFKLLEKHDPALAATAAFKNLQGIDHVHHRRLDDARAAFAAAYSQDRQNPVIVYNIGYFFDRYASNKSAAIQLYRTCIRLAADRPEYAALAAEAQQRLGALGR